MVSLHPQFITDSAGNKLVAVLPIAEYEALLESMEMEEDVKAYLDAKASNEEFSPAAEVYARIDAQRAKA